MSFRRAVLLAFLFSGLSSLTFAGPVISSFSPVYGSSTDPNYITISGSGFYPGSLVVKFNGVQAATATATSSSIIQARVPAGAPLGPGKLFVSVDGVSTLSAQDFTVIGAGPYVTSFTPTIGSDGSMAFISGAHFTGTTGVKFNGKAAGSYFVQSDTQIQATAPANVTSGPLVITTSSGSYNTSTNSSTPYFYVPPSVTGLSPANGRAGTNVIISGVNLLGTSSVQFGSVASSTFTVLSNNAVQAMVPPGAQTDKVQIVAPAGSAISGNNFVVLPTVSDFSPGSGPVGTSVTITGANFLGATSVKFNGANATPAGVSYNQLSAVVPAGATTGPITVVTTNGSSMSAANFYLPASITSFTPTTGAPGSFVRINGANFTGAYSVSFNGLAAPNFYITNNTTIGAMVPPGYTTGPISVTTPAGTATSSQNFFAPPSIFSFSPAHGLPGTNVVITGANFLGATVVSFNGASASFVAPTDNSTLTATVPNGATTGPITVGTPGGTNTSVANFVLDYTSDIGVTITASPSPVFIGSNLVYTIVVANAGPFAAPAVQLTEQLPDSVIVQSSSTTQGTLNTSGNPVVGSLGSIAKNGQVTVILTVKPQAEGNITNSAWVQSGYDDPNLPNNTNSLVTTVLPLPLLSIQTATGKQIKVSWPVLLTNYSLQFATNLAAPITWSTATNTPVISGAQRVVTETNSEREKFFRLKN